VKTVRKGAQRLTYLAVFIALNVVLARIASVRLVFAGVEGIRIGLGGLPVIMAGVLWGPVAGGIVGAMGDMIGYFLNPAGPYMPHFTLSAALTGVIPALVLRILGREKSPGPGALMLAILVGQTITSLILVPYFLQTLFGIPWRPLLVARVVSQAINIPAYAFIIHTLVRRLGLLFGFGWFSS
jgi:ECF transporter S component (folate family)